MWIGTSQGLARSADRGKTWQRYDSFPEFASNSIYALSINNDTVWTSTGYTKEVNGSSVQTGSGYTYSLTNGTSWTKLPQTLDAQDDSIVTYGANRVNFLPIIVPEQNVTFDLALSKNTVWISSWSSGIRKSTDRGTTWQRIVLPSKGRDRIAPTDSLGYYLIDPRTDNNFLGFSVCAQSDSVIWAGTAGGVNRSPDGGISWQKFTRTNQLEPILSDWVIAIAVQRFGGLSRVWTTNWPAEGTDQQYGVSYTDNDGRSWKNFLAGIKAYAFAFRDSIAYVATDEGVYRTANGGATWDRSGTITGSTPGSQLVSPSFFCVGVVGDTLFAGTSEGLVMTVDNGVQPFGQDWEVFRSYVPLASANDVYAYPNPFTPRSEPCRIHYKTSPGGNTVTVEIFDFGMNRVRTVVRDAVRPGDTETDEVWDGRTDAGEVVRNGVYFYRVSRSGQEPLFGKIMVLQ